MSRKTTLKDILSLLTGTQKAQTEPCKNTEPAPPLDILYPKTPKSPGGKNVKISDKKLDIDLSDFIPSSGDESGTDNSLTGIFTRVLTGVRKKKG